jgi:hypothetical protein
LCEAIEYPERVEDPQQNLEAYRSISLLQADYRLASDPGPVGQLRLGEVTELSP